MEEKKKVFIRGRKGREQEVIDILTGLGANVPKFEFGKSDDYLYFIHHNNEIGVALINSEVGAIIMDNYKEIELPQHPWEDGDILVYNSNPFLYAVFAKYRNDHTFETFFVLCQKEVFFNTVANIEDYHLTNEKEKEGFYRWYDYMKSYLNAANTVLKRNG